MELASEKMGPSRIKTWPTWLAPLSPMPLACFSPRTRVCVILARDSLIFFTHQHLVANPPLGLWKQTQRFDSHNESSRPARPRCEGPALPDKRYPDYRDIVRIVRDAQ